MSPTVDDDDDEGKIALLDIRPDPEQPRQLLPAKFQLPVLNDSPVEIIQDWKSSGLAVKKFLEVSRLADSISQHGLINPITICPAPEAAQAKYLIVTGERRWWAHVLLTSEGREIQEGNKLVKPDEIKANMVAKGTLIRAHQLIENLVREDLGVVEKARGIWALRRELSEVNGSREGMVPWAEVEKSLKISRRYRIYITNSLELCGDALWLIQNRGLSERVIRPVVSKLRNQSDDLQVKALQKIVAYNEEEESVTMLKFAKQVVDDLLSDLRKEDVVKAIKDEGLLADGTPWFMNDPAQFFDYLARKLNVSADVIEAVWIDMQFNQPAPKPAPTKPDASDATYDATHEPAHAHEPAHEQAAHEPEHEQATHEAAHEQAAHEQAAHEQAAHEPAHEQAAHEPAHEQAAHEPAHEQAAHEPEHEQATHEAAHEQAAHEAAHEQAAHEPAHEQAAHERAHEQAAHEPAHEQAAHEPEHEQAGIAEAMSGVSVRKVPRTAGAGNSQGRKPKWHAGKTKPIRVPEIFADRLLAMAKEWDDEYGSQNGELRDKNSPCFKEVRRQITCFQE